MGCILIRLHQRLRTNMVLFFALSLGLLHFVHLNSCRSYIETWGGLLPVQVSITCSATLAANYSSILLEFHIVPLVVKQVSTRDCAGRRL